MVCLNREDRVTVLAALFQVYWLCPCQQHAHLVALLYWRTLETLARRYPDAALPSELLELVWVGLQKGKSRYLGVWLASLLRARQLRVRRTREAERFAGEWVQGDLYQTPSDPGLRRLMVRAYLSLTRTQQQTLSLLAQRRTTQEIAATLNISDVAARRRISDTREAFRRALKKVENSASQISD